MWVRIFRNVLVASRLNQYVVLDAAAELGNNPVSTRLSLSIEMSRLTRDGTAEAVSRDQMLRRERGQGNIHFPCSADHGQDWQPYPVDPYSCYMCDHTYIIVQFSGLIEGSGLIVSDPSLEALVMRRRQSRTLLHSKLQSK